MTDSPASWKPDPTGRHDHRWWNGTAWTDNVADRGVRGKDVYDGDADTAGDGTAEVDAAAAAAPTVATTPSEPTPMPSPRPTPTPAPAPTGPTGPTAAAAPAEAAAAPKRSRAVLAGAVVALVVVVVAVLAITGDDGDGHSSVEQELIDTLQREQPALSDKTAECVAQQVIDQVGADKVSPDARKSGQYDAEIVDAYANAANRCGLLSDATASPSSTPGLPDLGGAQGGLPGLDGGPLQVSPEQLLEVYETHLNLPHDTLVCLRDGVVAGTRDLATLLPLCHVTIDDLTRAVTPGG